MADELLADGQDREGRVGEELAAEGVRGAEPGDSESDPAQLTRAGSAKPKLPTDDERHGGDSDQVSHHPSEKMVRELQPLRGTLGELAGRALRSTSAMQRSVDALRGPLVELAERALGPTLAMQRSLDALRSPLGELAERALGPTQAMQRSLEALRSPLGELAERALGPTLAMQRSLDALRMPFARVVERALAMQTGLASMIGPLAKIAEKSNAGIGALEKFAVFDAVANASSPFGDRYLNPRLFEVASVLQQFAGTEESIGWQEWRVRSPDAQAKALRTTEQLLEKAHTSAGMESQAYMWCAQAWALVTMLWIAGRESKDLAFALSLLSIMLALWPLSPPQLSGEEQSSGSANRTAALSELRSEVEKLRSALELSQGPEPAEGVNAVPRASTSELHALLAEVRMRESARLVRYNAIVRASPSMSARGLLRVEAGELVFVSEGAGGARRWRRVVVLLPIGVVEGWVLKKQLRRLRR